MDRQTAETMRDRWSARLSAAREAAAMASEEIAEQVAATVPQLAIGLSNVEDRWSLAIRVQRDTPEIEEIIEQLLEDAGGEANVRRICRVEALACSPRQRVRPVLTGVSCAHRQGGPGTIACFVRNRNDAGSPRFLLSNNHVIGLLNLASKNDVILQPARADMPTGNNAVAFFEKSVKLTTTHNLVDAAIARIDEPCDVRMICGRTVPIAGIRITPLNTGETVTKVGRTTGFRTGKVFASGVNNLKVEYDDGRNRFFDNQIEIEPTGEPFCDRGDSGALIVDDNSFAVGLLFGKSAEENGLAYANPIAEVLDRLQVDLE